MEYLPLLVLVAVDVIVLAFSTLAPHIDDFGDHATVFADVHGSHVDVSRLPQAQVRALVGIASEGMEARDQLWIEHYLSLPWLALKELVSFHAGIAV
jgi:hypothetical protein